MTPHRESEPSRHRRAEFPEAALRALPDGVQLLWRALNYARDAGADRWEFAVEIQQFYEQGLSDNELRWLVARGYAEHGRETSAVGDVRRSFKPSVGLVFSQATALVLTESGAIFASQASMPERDTGETTAAVQETRATAQSSSVPPASNGARNGDGAPQVSLKPTWDAALRELRVDGELVKWFRVPAPSQEVVLSAFEEESWPASIDDPLPVVGGAASKRRLNTAIARLNGNQTNQLIQFRADGRGEGIRWKLISDGHRQREFAASQSPILTVTQHQSSPDCC